MLLNDIKTGVRYQSRDELGSHPFTAQVVSGVEAAGARPGLSCGTCEGAPRYCRQPGWRREGDLQAAESARSRVPSRGALADSTVVAVILLRIAVGRGAKGRGRPG